MQNVDTHPIIMDDYLKNWSKFNDIKMREILQVIGYKLETLENLKQKQGYVHTNPLSNISYFTQSPSLICSGFEIATIDGIISIPVISMIHIRAKTEIKNSLLEYLPLFKEKNRKQTCLYLLYYTQLPIELIQYIMKFY